MKKKILLQQDFLDSNTLKDSESVNCRVFSGQDAKTQALSLGLPSLDIISQAIMIGDSTFNSEDSRFDRARFIARWGKIGAQVMLLLKKTSNEWEFKNESQPRIVNEKRNIQIIFMSGNQALGNPNEILSASCTKGFITIRNIDVNENSYDDDSKMRTWILYFPSRSHISYRTDLPVIPYELAYPTSYTHSFSKSKLKILPKDHSCRILFEIDNNMPIGTDPNPEINPSDEITEDDFDIQFTG